MQGLRAAASPEYYNTGRPDVLTLDFAPVVHFGVPASVSHTVFPVPV